MKTFGKFHCAEDLFTDDTWTCLHTCPGVEVPGSAGEQSLLKAENFSMRWID